MPTEFGLIARYFTRSRRTPAAAGFAPLGIGDDCALLTPAADTELAVSTDMLVAGRHFFADAAPRAIGHKALAVNLSDLAAMGATPRAFSLALALPEAVDAWLAPFSDGLFALADRHGCELIGGDTTGTPGGPLTICITVFGELPRGTAIRRDGARPGDDVWVSGTLGDARLALGEIRGDWPGLSISTAEQSQLRAALEYPQPRLELGWALRGLATSMLDLSDGLAGDLGHVLERSQVAATIDADAVPRSAILARQPLPVQRQCTLSGGDDYELCLSAPPSARAPLAQLAARLGIPLTRIGTITALAAASSGNGDRNDTTQAEPGAGINWQDSHGLPLGMSFRGFDHFDAD